VLDATSYMTKDTDKTFKRMVETLEMVIDCIDDDDALKLGNRGFNSVLKVRFLHSRIRLHLLKTSGKRNKNAEETVGGSEEQPMGSCPFHQGFHVISKSAENQKSNVVSEVVIEGTETVIKSSNVSTKDNKDTVKIAHNSVIGRPDWNTKEYGFPINQEDMVATLLSFSVVVLDVIEEFSVSGSLSREDKEAYIHLWRYIGYLIGVNEDLNPCVTVEKAGGLIESIVIHLIHPDERRYAFLLLFF
jgi:hypothetical protein